MVRLATRENPVAIQAAARYRFIRKRRELRDDNDDLAFIPKPE